MAPRRLADVRSLILDMDGVLYRGSTPLPGVHEFFALLSRRGVEFRLATNNSSRTPQDYVAKLAGMGVEVPPERIITAATATALHLRRSAPRGSRIYLIGEEGLRTALEQQGFDLVDDDADYVVVGVDFHLTYDKLKAATRWIREGAVFIGANPDKTFPYEKGLAPGCGAILAALEASTDRRPQVIGKPHPTMFNLALEQMGAGPKHAAIVGDRLETDIQGGLENGLSTILLLTGVTTREVLAESGIRPDWVFEGLPELVDAWQDPLREACATSNPRDMPPG